MGLDLDSADGEVEIFRGAYSVFFRFRRMIFALATNQQFLDVTRLSDAELITGCGINQGLRLFMIHSDCEGKWTATQCKTIAVMLRRVLKKTKEVEVSPGHVLDWFETTEKFIKGLEYCVKYKQRARFH
jgi:hypothetical protein